MNYIFNTIEEHGTLFFVVEGVIDMSAISETVVGKRRGVVNLRACVRACVLWTL